MLGVVLGELRNQLGRPESKLTYPSSSRMSLSREVPGERRRGLLLLLLGEAARAVSVARRCTVKSAARRRVGRRKRREGRELEGREGGMP